MPRFEYWHEHIDAQSGNNRTYPYEEITDYLTQLGEEGWELVNMAPDWNWGYNSVIQEHVYEPNEFAQSSGRYEVIAPYSVPRFVSGWYCTFKRQID